MPAQVDDALSVYSHLISTYPQQKFVLAGDSAGGGLVAALLLALREANVPMPACAVMESPWVDLRGGGVLTATTENADLDYLSMDMLSKLCSQILGELPADDWRASPVLATGSLQSLPPLLVVYAADEVLRGHSECLLQEWTLKGARMESHVVVKGGVHVPTAFQVLHRPSAQAATAMAEFIGHHTTTSSMVAGPNLLMVPKSVSESKKTGWGPAPLVQ